MDVNALSKNIKLSAKGYWTTNAHETISYTEDGHRLIAESEDKSFWFQHRLECLTEVIRQYPVTEIMDVGGGNGQIAKFLQDQKVDAVLLEPMINGVLNAQNKGVKKIIWGSLESVQPERDAVPAVGLFDVLEHIEKDTEVLSQLYRTLKPGGTLLLTVPALQSLYSDFDKEVGHFRRYTLSELRTKLSQSGFDIAYESYLFFPLPLLIWPVRKFYKFVRSDVKRRKVGHIRKDGLAGKLIGLYLKIELFMIRKKIKIPIGSTCLVVACKH